MVKTKACGLCCWDSWLYRGVNAPGPMPYVIGHEGVGEVYKVGADVTGLKVGDKVFCASGSNEMMCEYFTVTQDCLVKLPDDTEDWAKVVFESPRESTIRLAGCVCRARCSRSAEALRRT